MNRIKIRRQRWLLIVPALVLFVWLGVSGFSMMRADIYQQHVNRYLEYWAEGYRQNDREYRIVHADMAIALRNATRAVRLQPDDPTQRLLLAKVLEWQSFYLPGENNPRMSLPGPLDLIRTAVALRPAWPYGWIVLAEVKARHSEIDEEFNQAVIQAGTMGQWEPWVMTGIHRLDSQNYSGLSPAANVVFTANKKRLQIKP